MEMIEGEYRMKVKDLMKELAMENPEAMVVVNGARKSDKDGYLATTIYKTATAADDSIVYLYMGGDWPSSES